MPSLHGVSQILIRAHAFGHLGQTGHVPTIHQAAETKIAKETQACFALTAGDNVAESVALVLKQQLRRMGLLNIPLVTKSDIEICCVHNKEPGLLRVMCALAMRKQKASAGLTTPADALRNLCGACDAGSAKKR